MKLFGMEVAKVVGQFFLGLGAICLWFVCGMGITDIAKLLPSKTGLDAVAAFGQFLMADAGLVLLTWAAGKAIWVGTTPGPRETPR